MKPNKFENSQLKHEIEELKEIQKDPLISFVLEMKKAVEQIKKLQCEISDLKYDLKEIQDKIHNY